MSKLTTIIKSVGGYLPEKRLSNHDLEKLVDTNDEWIRRRTGIEARHIAADDELASDMGVKAALIAMERAGIGPKDIDMVICATTTPDNTFPATATRIQAKLDIPACPAFDVQAVCAGFLFGLGAADNAIKAGQAKTILLVGCERYSGILDWQDRITAVLFGDGAGAVILQANQTDDENPQGVLALKLMSDGRFYDSLYVDGGPGQPATQKGGRVGVLQMNGQEVYRQAIQKMSEIIETVCSHAGMTTQQLDWLVPHQANRRIIEQVGLKLNIPDEKVIISLQEHANTSAATIPLALESAYLDGRLQRGHIVGLTALGGGFSWGGAVVRW